MFLAAAWNYRALSAHCYGDWNMDVVESVVVGVPPALLEHPRPRMAILRCRFGKNG